MAQELDFGTQRGESLFAVGSLSGGQIVPEPEEDDGENNRQKSGNARGVWT